MTAAPDHRTDPEAETLAYLRELLSSGETTVRKAASDTKTRQPQLDAIRDEVGRRRRALDVYGQVVAERDHLRGRIESLATWILDHQPEAVISGGAIDAAIKLLEQAFVPTIKPAEGKATRRSARRFIPHTDSTPTGRLEPAVDRPPYPPPMSPDEQIRAHLLLAELPPSQYAGTVVSPDVDADMRKIANVFRAVEYDAGDRPEERAAVIIAAVCAGLTPIPSETITPRSYRGCAGPAPAAASAWPSPPVVAETEAYRQMGITPPADVDPYRELLVVLTRASAIARNLEANHG